MEEKCENLVNLIESQIFRENTYRVISERESEEDHAIEKCHVNLFYFIFDVV